MNSELLATLEYIEQERGIGKEQLARAVENALMTASRKSIHPASELSVKLDLKTGEIKAWAKLKVVEAFPTNDEIRLEDVRKRYPEAQIGDIVEWEVTPRNFGRIAAQAARQAIAQQLRDAEKIIVQDEFKDKVGQIVSGNVRRLDGRNVIVDFQKAEGVINEKGRVPGEQFMIGERISALLAEINIKVNPSLILSRSSAHFVRRLFEREVSEIHDGVVEIVAISREPGVRSKVAVRSNDPRVDPVGACVGMRGLRVRNITNELNGERIDVIPYSEDLRTYLENAMHPAKLLSVEIDGEARSVVVHVDAENSRLAFGRKGQNVRLAQKLLGWTIQIIVDESAEEEFEKKKAQAVADLATAVGIPESAAELLVQHGYLTIEGLRSAPADDLQQIEGLDAGTLEAIASAVEKADESANE